MNLNQFLHQLKQSPTGIQFSQTMAIIEEHYNFEETAFQNGLLYNKAGENSGSCKLFAFCQLQQLTEQETLACFGTYYFEDVLKDPNGTNHQNIRNFIKTGWAAVRFEGDVLQLK